jgi:hypothetical protein
VWSLGACGILWNLYRFLLVTPLKKSLCGNKKKKNFLTKERKKIHAIVVVKSNKRSKKKEGSSCCVVNAVGFVVFVCLRSVLFPPFCRLTHFFSTNAYNCTRKKGKLLLTNNFFFWHKQTQFCVFFESLSSSHSVVVSAHSSGTLLSLPFLQFSTLQRNDRVSFRSHSLYTSSPFQTNSKTLSKEESKLRKKGICHLLL